MPHMYRVYGPGFEYRRGQEVSVVSKTFRPALGPTHPSVQWLPVSFPGAKQPECVSAHLQLASRLRMHGAIPPWHAQGEFQQLTNLMHKILFYNKFIKCLYMFRAPCAHHQEVKFVLYSVWYRHTETSGWSKISVWRYQMLYNTILTSWWWAHSARNM